MRAINQVRGGTKRYWTIATIFMALAFIFVQPGSALGQWATNGNHITNTNSGNVGIGTMNPATKLQVFSPDSTNGQLQVSYDASNSLTMKVAGTGLTLMEKSNGLCCSNVMFRFRPSNTGSSVSPYSIFQVEDDAGNPKLTIGNDGALSNITSISGVGSYSTYGANSGGVINQLDLRNGHLPNGSGTALTFSTGTGPITTNARISGSAPGILTLETAGSERMRISDTGNVGIGTTNPEVGLHVSTSSISTGSRGIIDEQTSNDANGALMILRKSRAGGAVVNGDNIGNVYPMAFDGTNFVSGGRIRFGVDGAVTAGNIPTNIQFITGTNNTGVERMRVTSSGNVGIGTTTPTATLDVNGNINVSGNINAKYQDVAEWVPASHAMPAGTVVVLDPEKSNQVMSSSKAYDTAVAGVVSAQPGIALGESGAGKVLIATTGRVKVKVDATREGIKVGDLLVTGKHEGMAMKSVPMMIHGRAFHSPGTLIGKALEPMEKGKTGEILVLLSLQ